MVDQRYIDYIRSNKDKYPIDSLKQNLLKAGVPPSEVEEAVRAATEPGQAVMPAAPPPVGPGAVFPAAQTGSAPSQNAPFNIQDLILQAKQVLLDPFGFFRAMPKKGGFRDPFIFLFSMALTQVLISLVLKFGLGTLGLGGGSFLGSTMSLTMMIGGVVLGLIMLPVIMLIVAAIAHVIWTLLGSKEEFETSFRCVAYVSALAPVYALVNSIPSIGMWLAIPVSLYGLYLYIPSSVEVHGIKKKTATIIFAVLAGLTLLSLIGSAIAFRKVKKMVKSAADSPLAESLGRFKELAEAGEKNNRPPVMQPDAPADTDTQGFPPAGRPMSQEQAMETAAAVLKTMADAKNVELVDHTLLKELLPKQLHGMTLTRATSSAGAGFGVKASAARATYTAAKGKTITIKLSDTGGLGGIFAMGWEQSGGSQQANRTTKLTEYKGFKAQEKYYTQSKRARLTVLVDKRFILEITGRSGFSIKNLRAVADAVDLDQLRSLAP